MGRPQRNIDGLVFTEQLNLAVDGDSGGPRHHHPVLGAVMVHLHRQSFPRLDGNALHLIALARVDGVVFAPRTVNLAVHVVLMASVGLDLLHHLFHVLHRVAIGNQHGVFGLHHHQILHADGGHQAGFGVNVAVFRFMADDVAVVDVSLRGVGADFPQRGPRADIAPARVHWHHHRVRRSLHHRVVNGLFRTGEEGLFIHANEVKIRIDAAHRLFTGGQNIGAELFQLFQIASGAEQKHAAVPVVIAAGDVGLGGFQPRLLNELRHLKSHRIRRARHDITAPDIAIAGFRQIRHDTEGHQFARVSIGHGAAHRVAEGLFIGDRMIRRQYQHQRIAVRMLARRCQRRQRNRRRGIAPGGLKNNVLRQLIELAELFGNDKAVLFVADNHRAFALHAVQTANGGLQHGEIAFQAQKLFWIKHARKRPQSATGATGHHNRVKFCLTHYHPRISAINWRSTFSLLSVRSAYSRAVVLFFGMASAWLIPSTSASVDSGSTQTAMPG